MSGEHILSEQTRGLLVVFLVLYFIVLFRRALQAKLDLIDFFSLFSVAAVPGFFALFPGIFAWASSLIGIQFPFVLLFGILFLILFLFSYSLVRRLNNLQTKVSNVTQELGLAELEIRRLKESKQSK